MRPGGIKLLISIFLLVFTAAVCSAQETAPTPWAKPHKTAEAYQLDRSLLQRTLTTASSRWERSGVAGGLPVALPQPDNSNQIYLLWRSEQMEPALAARFPSIQTYYGQSADDARQQVYLLQTPEAVKVLYFNTGGMYGRLEPADPALPLYRLTTKAQWGPAPELEAACRAVAGEDEDRLAGEAYGPGRRGETKLYRYRLALACTGEYAQYHGGTTAGVLAAMNELLLQVNAIYERELSVHFDLVAANDELIFLDPQTDPYQQDDVEALLEANKVVCNNIIGHQHFDLGQVLATRFGGQAHIGSVCNTSRKAKAFSGLPQPEGYYMGAIFAHELGHQLGAQHTQSNDCNRVPDTAYEPGSGSTLMAYAGLCSPNVQGLPDDYFHGNSLQLMAKKAAQGLIFGCALGQRTGNLPPQADAGPDLYVPIGTAFRLQGSGYDPDGDSLSYRWEQMDAWTAEDTVNLSGPLFRSRPPAASPVREIGGYDDLWEHLPQQARRATFRLTVRDQHLGLGTTAYDEMTVYFIDSAGPFAIIAPNARGDSWQAGTTQTISWDEAGTVQPPIGCDTVDVYLSADGGQTFPLLLAEGVPNTGLAEVTAPLTSGTRFRVKVSCRRGPVFDVSDHDFSIVADDQAPAADAASPVPAITALPAIVPIPSDTTDCPGCYAEIGLFPNPAVGRSLLQFTTRQPLHGTFDILDAHGKIWQRQILDLEAGRHTLALGVSTYPPGLYWIRVRVNGGYWTKAMMVSGGG